MTIGIIIRIFFICIEIWILLNVLTDLYIIKKHLKSITIHNSGAYIDLRHFKNPFKVLFCSVFVIFYLKRFKREAFYEYSVKRLEMLTDLRSIYNGYEHDEERTDLTQKIKQYELRLKLLKIKRKTFRNKFNLIKRFKN